MATANRLSSERKLKLLFILDTFADPSAGTEGQFWLLFNQLDRSRVEPAIVLLRPSAYLQERITDATVKVLNVERLRSLQSVRRVFAAVGWARRAGFEVAHIFFNDAALIFPVPLALAGLRVIVSRRDLGFWYTRANLPLLRFNRHFVAAVVANCKAVKVATAREERYPPGKIAVIYNGIRRTVAPAPEESLARLGVPPGVPLIAIVANLRVLKRVQDAITALARATAAAHLLVIGEDRDGAGGSSHRAELEALAATLGLADRVRFAGKIEDPMPLLSRASLCMLCSQTEGLSNSIIEYMLAGKPVICTDAGGNAELVADGDNGFVVPIGDVTAIAAALDRLLMDADLAQRMGRRSRARALALFDPQRMLDEHMALYQRVRAAS